MNVQADLRSKFYDSLLQWVLKVSEGATGGFLVGLNGPQGVGKSTLCAALCELLAARGKRALAISIDDFYLTHEQQLALAASHPGNPFLQQRGYPGTHDLELGAKVLSWLKQGEDRSLRLPRYNKAAFLGEGDRFSFENWPQVALPVDIVLLEGWMLGFPSVSSSALPNEHLREVNEQLAAYSLWNEKLDAFVQLDPEDHLFVLDWRVEAEQKMRAQGKGGMSDEAIRAYVQKFLPAYEIYLPALRLNPPLADKVLRVRIGKNRLPVDWNF